MTIFRRKITRITPSKELSQLNAIARLAVDDREALQHLGATAALTDQRG